jgi:hypothetical protein
MVLILAAQRGRREAEMLLAGLESFFGVIFFDLGFILLWALITTYPEKYKPRHELRFHALLLGDGVERLELARG